MKEGVWGSGTRGTKYELRWFTSLTLNVSARRTAYHLGTLYTSYRAYCHATKRELLPRRCISIASSLRWISVAMPDFAHLEDN